MKQFLHYFLVTFLLFSFILLVSVLFASILFWNAESVKYCLPFISSCQQLNEKELNETEKYEATKEEETPYSIWKKCLNAELDPCDNFYQFSCSNYEAEYKTMDMDNSYYFSKLTDLAQDQINECFSDTFYSDKSNSSSAVQKMRQYQNEYYQTEGIDEVVSVRKLIEEIKSFGSCPALSLNKEWKNKDISQMLLKMTDLTALPYLYEIDQKDFIKYRFYPIIRPARLIFSNPSTTLKTQHYYYKGWLRRLKEEQMRNFFAQIFELISETVKEIDEEEKGWANFDGGAGSGQNDYDENEVKPKNYTKIAQELVDLELKFIRVYEKSGYFSSDELTYKYQVLNPTEYEKQFGIAGFQKYLFNNSQISTEFYEYLYQNEYLSGYKGFSVPKLFFPDLPLIFQTTGNEILANYLCLRYVLDRMPYLNYEFRQLAVEFEENFDGEIHQLLPTYNEDTKEHLESMFPLVADHLFVTHCKSSSKQLEKAREIVKNVLDASIKWIEKAEWLDPVSQQNALEKINSTLIVVGALEIALNQTKLDKMYEKLDFKESDGIMEMERKLCLFNAWQKLSVLHAYDNYAYFTALERRASVINAYANKKHLYIFLPLGYLFEPNFDINQPYSSNYATLGRTTGHEFFHLLDSVQYLFDGEKQTIFADPETKADFEDKTLCLQKQYTRQYDDSSDLNLNGEKTLDEDISDNAGIRVAYYAYLNWLKKEGRDEKVPGYSQFTHEQSFFIAYAVKNCAAISSLQKKLYIKNQYHSLPEYRVNMPLKNFHEFSKTFNCSIGSKMNPRKKCRVWKKK